MVWDVSLHLRHLQQEKGQEANHWWMVALGDVPCFEQNQPHQRFTLMPWNPAESRNTDIYRTFVDNNAATLAMTRFMSDGVILPEIDSAVASTERSVLDDPTSSKKFYAPATGDEAEPVPGKATHGRRS